MKNKKLLRIVAILSASSMLMTGCSSFVSEDVASYPLAPSMTSAELIDYYAKALDYDSVVSRNVTVHETKYEVKDISGAKADRLKELAAQCEALLGQNEYNATEESLKILSYDTYEYIKSTIDNEVLTDGKVENITGALGYYFVDIKYNISAKQPGSFKDLASMVGLNGIFRENYLGEYLVDTSYVTVMITKLNEYYSANRIAQHAIWDSAANTVRIVDGEAPAGANTVVIEENNGYVPEEGFLDGTDEGFLDGTDEIDEESLETSEESDNTETEEEASETNTDEDVADSENTDETSLDDVVDGDITEPETTESEPILPITNNEVEVISEVSQSGKYTIVTPSNRRPQLDIELINEIAGSSVRQLSVCPSLDMMYTKPTAEGTMSGYGIYTAGGNGLKTFGFDRSKLDGTITLRYVFKDDTAGTGNIYGVNIYVTEEDITNGINITDNNVLIPEFLQSQLEQLIERSDRAQVNYDLSALMSGAIYEDLGIGMLRANKNKNTNVNKYMSKIRQVISRDTANNSYLVEVETTTIEGPKDVDAYGTYKDIYYVVVQQQDDKFIITDWLRSSRIMTSEPPINPDSNVQKRLIALNLAGTISDDTKEYIKELLGHLYTSGTNRIAYGPREVTINGQTVTINYGMYDCFSSDTSVLSADDLEYQNSTLRNTITKKGMDIKAVFSGTVTEWIGGYENQAEFTTEELITYQGLNCGHYMQVYYLVSLENDRWVIDERNVLDEYEISDAETLSTVQGRVGQ